MGSSGSKHDTAGGISDGPKELTGGGVSSSSDSGFNDASGASNGGIEKDRVAHGGIVAQTATGCPVKKGNQLSHSTQQPADGCPVIHGQSGSNAVQYNVYAQPIDPQNQMPLNPNQLPAPGQSAPLSTERVRSFIPKGGTTQETWQYPSSQMFYNALVRKGKVEDVEVSDVDTIVAVHNNMNEKAWGEVEIWEKNLHKDDYDSGGIKLSRFMGRPDDLSPMAWFKSTFLGMPRPFDRHDWVIDRNGKEVRYVIDYYYDEDSGKYDEKPTLHAMKSIKSITMDVRPAIDSLESLMDRFKYKLMSVNDKLQAIELGKKLMENSSQQQNAAKQDDQAVDERTSFDLMTADQLSVYSEEIQKKCSNCFEALTRCSTESECQRSSVVLTHCMASLVCKPEASRFAESTAEESRFDDMVDCMARFESAAKRFVSDPSKLPEEKTA